MFSELVFTCAEFCGISRNFVYKMRNTSEFRKKYYGRNSGRNINANEKLIQERLLYLLAFVSIATFWCMHGMSMSSDCVSVHFHVRYLVHVRLRVHVQVSVYDQVHEHVHVHTCM
jgi:hypothetical protein